ncbi:hypothetical protein C8039_08420 [Halogeometricum sp. wsp3]|nr:hypothetical protein C8039_08420 [Halogeometricum sp. wsp3]
MRGTISQSHKYFADISKTIKKDLIHRTPLKRRNNQLYRSILESNSVSLHIRRGDYEDLGKQLSVDYYVRAISKIQSMVEKPHFFIFSDDKKYVRNCFLERINKLFPRIEYTIVDGNTSDPTKDLRLMRECDHNIIANSTFSWWGAWLNEKDDNIVLAPGTWHSHCIDDIDVIPSSWNSISVS